MNNTLILYEGKYGTTKKTAVIFGYIIGNTKVLDIVDAPKSLEKYANIIFAFALYGPYTASKTKEYMSKYNKQFIGKKICLAGIGLSKADFNNHLNSVREILSRTEECNTFVEGELRLENLSQIDLNALEKFSLKTGLTVINRGNYNVNKVVEAAIDLKNKINSIESVMDRTILKEEIDKFIAGHNTFALSTGIADYERCTPLEYQYINNSFYIITEGGLKFKGILQNENVSVSIYDNYESMANLKGIQIAGHAEILPLFSDEYCRVIENRGIKLNVVKEMSINLYVIKITPKIFEFLNSDFKKRGYDSKQKYIAD